MNNHKILEKHLSIKNIVDQQGKERYFKLGEINNEIKKKNMNAKKSPGFDLISVQIWKEFSKKGTTSRKTQVKNSLEYKRWI